MPYDPPRVYRPGAARRAAGPRPPAGPRYPGPYPPAAPRGYDTGGYETGGYERGGYERGGYDRGDPDDGYRSTAMYRSRGMSRDDDDADYYGGRNVAPDGFADFDMFRRVSERRL